LLLQVDATEVRLRRTIGASKSEYLLNGRHITADDVMNLLESAGLSRANPYYIVQQGKVPSPRSFVVHRMNLMSFQQVRALAQMKPEERLEVLREVAGTKVYDERRLESVKIMEDTKGRRAQIEELMKILDERMGELEQEKSELSEYQVLYSQMAYLLLFSLIC
jgi:structural maintenance of chromosome 3 (chondroitin sulfate proteoglycan 6)